MTDKKNKELEKTNFALAKENYLMLLAGFAVIVIGFMLMAGGGAENPTEFSEEIFSFRRITLAPIVVVAGFVFEIYAIMYKPKTKESGR